MKQPGMYVLLLFLGLSISASRLDAQVVVDIGRQYYEPTREVVTPHIAWANPSAHGPLRVLFLGARDRMREVVELAQRMEMDYAFVGFEGDYADDLFRKGSLRKGSYKGDEEGDKAKRLRSLLEGPEYDLIVLGPFNWQGLPLFAKFHILRQVKQGAGLVKLSTSRGRYEDEYLERATAETVPIPPSVFAGVPWQALPIFGEYPTRETFIDRTFEASAFGKGRIVKIKGYLPADYQLISPSLTPLYTPKAWWNWWGRRSEEYKQQYPEANEPIKELTPLYYDYNLAMMIKVMTWAANRESPVIIQEPGTDRHEKQDAFSQVGFTVQSNADQPMVNLSVAFILRDKNNRILASENRESFTLQPGTQQLAFPVENIPAGKYFADLWIRRTQRTLAFGSVALDIHSASTIKQITLDRDAYRVEQPITVTLTFDLPERKAKSYALRVRQWDNLDRLVREQVIPIEDQHLELTLPPVATPKTVNQFLEFDLISDNRVLDRRREGFTFANLYLTDTIRIATWQKPVSSYVGYRYYQRFYEIGMDSVGFIKTTDSMLHDYFGLGANSSVRVGQPDVAVRANLRYIPPIARFTDLGMYVDKQKAWLGAEGDTQIEFREHERIPCINDPRYNELLQDRIKAVVAFHAKRSTREYLFDQEPCFTQSWHRTDGGELCHCHLCVDYFRNWLQRHYGSIDKVNAEYGTDYTDYNQIGSVRVEHVMADPSLAPHWADYRMAMDSSFSAFFERMAKTAESLQPEARTGDYAPIYTGFRTGEAVDMWKFTRWTKMSCPYPLATEQIRADFALPGNLTMRGAWWGPAQSRSIEFATFHPWSDLFQGTNFFYSYLGDTRCLIANDLSLYPDVAQRLDQMLEIKNTGIGKMIHEADRSHGGVAILYSIASNHHWTLSESLGHVQGNAKRFGNIMSESMRQNNAAWMAILTDLQIPFRYVSYEQLADGILERDGFDLLILPWSQALSKTETDQIKSFVAAGGNVIADLRPGVSDAHCKPYPVSPLDELFGVTQETQKPRVMEESVSVPFDEGGDREVFGTTYTDPDVQLAGGTAAGITDSGTPAYIQHAFGQGQAVFLNMGVQHYVRNHSVEDRSDHIGHIRRFLKNVLTRFNLPTPVIATPDQPQLRQYWFTANDHRYLGLIQEPSEPWINYAAKTAAPLAARRISLKLQKVFHIYDARIGRYMGFTNDLTTYITPTEAKVLSLLPYEVHQLILSAPNHIQQGDRFEYQIQIAASATPQKHIVRLEVTDPTGKALRQYATNLTVTEGSYKGDIYFAINEMPGEYTITIRDAATGECAATTFHIQHRGQKHTASTGDASKESHDE